ncbi:MAG: hypothetical protein MZV70_29675 [Desulfobacterales bacterium]|nr:hypothetical protein [Desulfobacterales bacterium]
MGYALWHAVVAIRTSGNVVAALLSAIGLIVISMAVLDIGKYLIEEEVLRDRELALGDRGAADPDQVHGHHLHCRQPGSHRLYLQGRHREPRTPALSGRPAAERGGGDGRAGDLSEAEPGIEHKEKLRDVGRSEEAAQPRRHPPRQGERPALTRSPQGRRTGLRVGSCRHRR